MIRDMTRTALSRLVVLLIAAGLLTACGQKGALYLPDAGAAPVTATPPAATIPGTEPDRSAEPRKRIH